MKNVVTLTALLLVLAACGGNKQQSQTEETRETATADVPVYALDDLLAVAEQNIDKTVKVEGYVTHTCKHAGKRCFIVGESQKASMRIEAKGEIGGFNRELAGSKIQVSGVLKERRFSQEYIDQMEKDVNAKKAEDGSAESCAAEMSNINEMRQWMKDNNKEYYSVFYMDGQDYVVVE